MRLLTVWKFGRDISKLNDKERSKVRNEKIGFVERRKIVGLGLVVILIGQKFFVSIGDGHPAAELPGIAQRNRDRGVGFPVRVQDFGFPDPLIDRFFKIK